MWEGWGGERVSAEAYVCCVCVCVCVMIVCLFV